MLYLTVLEIYDSKYESKYLGSIESTSFCARISQKSTQIFSCQETDTWYLLKICWKQVSCAVLFAIVLLAYRGLLINSLTDTVV